MLEDIGKAMQGNTSDIDKERLFLVEQYSKLSCEQEKTLERVLEILPELRELTVVWVSKDEDDNTWQVQLGLVQENGEASALAIQDYLDLDTQTRAYLGFQTDTGDLIGYSISYPDWASEEEPSPEMALQRADTFIKSIMGENAVKYQGWHHSISMRFDKEENGIVRKVIKVGYSTLIYGIPIPMRYIEVSVDATGEIIDYSKDHFLEIQTWEALDLSLFVHPDRAVITLPEAKRILQKDITMDLVYMIPYFEPGQVELIYVVRDMLPAIDVITGENPLWYMNTITKKPTIITIHGKGGELIASDRKSAKQLLQQYFDADLEGLDFNEDRTSIGNCRHYCWSGEVENKQDSTSGIRRDIGLITKPDSEEVLDFYDSVSEKKERKEIISYEAALATALSFMESIMPVGENELMLTISSCLLAKTPEWVNVELEDRDYYQLNVINFCFSPTHKGIPITYKGMPVVNAADVVMVCMTTGKVFFYARRAPSKPADLPDASSVISPDKAVSEYVDNVDLQMVYIWPEWCGQKAPAPMLVYADRTVGWMCIDAITGKVV